MAEQTILNEVVDSNETFQALVDNTQEYFEDPMWGNYMDAEFTRNLDYKGVMAKYETSPMASFIDYSDPTKPIYAREGLQTFSGSLESLGMQYQMDAREQLKYDDYRLLAGVSGSGITSDMLEDIIIPDIKRASIGPQKSIAYMIYKGMSSNEIPLSKDANPRSKAYKKGIKIGFPEKKVTVKFSEPTSTPLKDLRDICKVYRDEKGVKPRFMFMSQLTFDQIQQSNEFKTAFKLRFPIGIGEMTEVDPSLWTESQVKSVLIGLDLPEAVIIDVRFPSEGAKGQRTYFQGFDDNRILLSTTKQMGTVYHTKSAIQRAYEKSTNSPKISATYTYNGLPVFLTKYYSGTNEITECDLCAFPVFNLINDMWLVKTDEVTS